MLFYLCTRQSTVSYRLNEFQALRLSRKDSDEVENLNDTRFNTVILPFKMDPRNCDTIENRHRKKSDRLCITFISLP